jgi:MFS family permease
VIGPEVARRFRDLLPLGDFSGSFAGLALLYALVAVLMLFLKNIAPTAEEVHGSERPLRQIIAQPVFLTAVFSGVVAYGVMSFIMTATPVQMNHIQHFDLGQTAFVIQSHVIAMFLPSLFSGFLIERFGTQRIMLAGLACFLATVLVGVYSRDLLHFWGALVLLGVGWNFLFVGSTVLLTEAYRPAERFKAQAANDFLIPAVQSLTSLSAGSVLFAANWQTLNLLNLPFLLLNLAALLWLWRGRPGLQAGGRPGALPDAHLEETHTS